MIDTVVFDIGNVLAEWHWRENFTAMFGEALVEPLADATVRSPEWYEMDRGVLSELELIALLTKNAPQHAAEIERIVRENHTFVTTYPYADNWLRGLHDAGYKCISSRTSAISVITARSRLHILKHADGALISYGEARQARSRDLRRSARGLTSCRKTPCFSTTGRKIRKRRAPRHAGGHSRIKAQADAALRELGVCWAE
ncbi:MAG: hypothetical protein ACLS7Z_11965 [Christensenellales bacterium]